MRLMDFCEKCGTIMDLPGGSKKSFEKMKEITCFNPNCTFKRPIQDYLDHKITYSLKYATTQSKGDEHQEEVLGPQIEHQCKVCRHNIATYFTRQMRSADEGQTVFYTCLKCRNVEREDS